jgi:hypothetical protein
MAGLQIITYNMKAKLVHKSTIINAGKEVKCVVDDFLHGPDGS